MESARVLAFWETLLRTRVFRVFFNDNWQYSSGCVFEFAVAYDAGLPTFDAHGAPISLGAGIGLIERAVAEMAADGIVLNSLSTNLVRLGSWMERRKSADPIGAR